jgi:hypothetical protein
MKAFSQHIFFYLLQTLLPQAEMTSDGNEPLIRPELTRNTQEFAGGKVQGDSESTGSTTNAGQAVSPVFGLGVASTSTGNGNFEIKSEGGGFVDTKNGGAEGKTASGVSGTSSTEIAPYVRLNGPYITGDFTVDSSSTADGKGAFIAGYSPDDSAKPTGGYGSGSGSAGAETSSALKPIAGVTTDAFGSTSNSAEAESFGGGSSTGFNNMASAGGVGSGSAEASASDVVNGVQVITFTGNQAGTATFTGSGSGINGKSPNQPYTGGTAIGSGNGSGAAIVGGSSSVKNPYFLVPKGITGDAAFKSTGGGSGFVDGSLGNANGSASGGASGAASGTLKGQLLPGLINPVSIGDLTSSGSSASNGNGAFVAGFSPSLEDGPTGASGSGNGSLNVAGSGSAKPGQSVNNLATGETSGSGTAETFGGGSGSGANTFGEAGGLGAGTTTGTASGGGTSSSFAPVLGQGTGTSTGTFDTVGAGSFGSPNGVLAFP